MEASHLERSPHVCNPVEENDAKYVSGLSTILVATIQEAKDRISQIEYIFCSQLYPNFQKSSKCLQKLYAEARRAAEDECRERESELQLQLKELCLEKELALEDCKAFKAERSRLLRRIAELEGKLLQKTKEADDGMELHGKLLDLIESKTSVVANKEKQMKEHEERVNLLLVKLEGLEGNIDALNRELHEKKEEVIKGKELREELQRQIESQAQKITISEQMLSNSEIEKQQLVVQLENMEARFGSLRDELRRKANEVDEGKKLREQLVQQIDSNGMELTKKDRQLSSHEREKRLLSSKINDLEKMVEELQENLRNIPKRSEYDNDLARQIELKSLELSSEKQKYKDLTVAYKKLKSQHNYLLSKCGLTNEDMLPQVKVEGDSDPSGRDNKQIPPPEINKRNTASNVVPRELNIVKKEIDSMESSDDEIGERLNQISGSGSPSSSRSPARTNGITTRKLASSAGVKRPASGSGWRVTRSCKSPDGPDPHDDFLDTPFESIRGNMHKAMKDNVHDTRAQASKDMVCDSLDDETQDIGAEAGARKQQLQAPRPCPKGYKYVEPVRKKAERENLNGIECKQCKKFYDAVLPDAGGKDGEVDKQNLRCEHHEGVSRHRYRYVPPMTPDGFWNIGFDTETQI